MGGRQESKIDIKQVVNQRCPNMSKKDRLVRSIKNQFMRINQGKNYRDN